jgi:hypothetical protein
VPYLSTSDVCFVWRDRDAGGGGMHFKRRGKWRLQEFGKKAKKTGHERGGGIPMRSNLSS